jgi:hypothetical protein
MSQTRRVLSRELDTIKWSSGAANCKHKWEKETEKQISKCQSNKVLVTSVVVGLGTQ